MSERQSKLINQKLDQLLLEKRMMQDNRKMMVCDQISAYNDKQLKRLEFIEVNNLLRQNKEDDKKYKKATEL